jgi:hypothetical protein
VLAPKDLLLLELGALDGLWGGWETRMGIGPGGCCQEGVEEFGGVGFEAWLSGRIR